MTATVRPDQTAPSSAWIDDLLLRVCLSLQLTPTQYKEAEQHYASVAKWLGASDNPLATLKPEIYPQGSLRIGTTVRPLEKDEFDLDLVCLLDLHNGSDPELVLRGVEQRLRQHGTLAPKVELKNRCVRLNYAGQFHLDILPARPDERLGGTCILVPDRELHTWKESNPKGYAGWFEVRGTILEEERQLAASVEPLPAAEAARDKTTLQLIVQLLKRWRDVRYAKTPGLAPISIVLTTLAGEHYRGELHPLQALMAAVSRIRSSIPSNGRLVVWNPRNQAEDLSERWDSDPLAYRAFVSGVSELEAQLRELTRVGGIDSAKSELSGLFGGALADTVVRQQAEAVAAARAKGTLGVTAAGSLTSITSASARPVRQHTFYGEE